MCSPDIFLYFIAILFPPFAVWVKRGLCSIDSVVNILLCCLGFFPGLIHAWYIICVTPDDYGMYAYEDGYGRVADVERTRVVYIAVPTSAPANQFPGQMPPEQQYQGRSGSQNVMGYGTVGPNQPGPHGYAGEDTGVVTNGDVPPTYTDAVKGDNKVQKP